MISTGKSRKKFTPSVLNLKCLTAPSPHHHHQKKKKKKNLVNVLWVRYILADYQVNSLSNWAISLCSFFTWNVYLLLTSQFQGNVGELTIEVYNYHLSVHKYFMKSYHRQCLLYIKLEENEVLLANTARQCLVHF